MWGPGTRSRRRCRECRIGVGGSVLVAVILYLGGYRSGDKFRELKCSVFATFMVKRTKFWICI